MKMYTTKSNAKRAAKALQAKYDCITAVDTMDNYKPGQFAVEVLVKAGTSTEVVAELRQLVQVTIQEAPEAALSETQVATMLGLDLPEENDCRREVQYNAAGDAIDPAAPPAAPVAEEKLLEEQTADGKLHKSLIDRPCKQVWSIAESMHDANPDVKRRDVLAQCEKEGIAYYTARTQYQQWLTVCKEMRAREAAQQAAKK